MTLFPHLTKQNHSSLKFCKKNPQWFLAVRAKLFTSGLGEVVLHGVSWEGMCHVWSIVNLIASFCHGHLFIPNIDRKTVLGCATLKLYCGTATIAAIGIGRAFFPDRPTLQIFGLLRPPRGVCEAHLPQAYTSWSNHVLEQSQLTCLLLPT